MWLDVILQDGRSNYGHFISVSCFKFKKFRSSTAHSNDLREKLKLKFIGHSKLELSSKLTVAYELELELFSQIISVS